MNVVRRLKFAKCPRTFGEYCSCRRVLCRQICENVGACAPCTPWSLRPWQIHNFFIWLVIFVGWSLCSVRFLQTILPYMSSIFYRSCVEALLTSRNPASVLLFDNDIKRTPLHAAGNILVELIPLHLCLSSSY